MDVALLDLGLPDSNGLDLLRRLRQSDDRLPVVVLTGRGRETDRVLGLELGADDYIVKPFSLPELAARLRAVLRRSTPSSRTMPIRAGELVMDIAAHVASLGSRELQLSPLEFALLGVLAGSPRQVFSAAQLLGPVWGSTADRRAPATVAEHVYRIRQKLRQAGATTPTMTTVRGVSYRLDP